MFAAERIETADFFLLTERDLKELRLPIGVRNRILAYQESVSASPLEVAGDPSLGILNCLQAKYFTPHREKKYQEAQSASFILQEQKEEGERKEEESQEETSGVKCAETPTPQQKAGRYSNATLLKNRYARRMEEIDEIERRSDLKDYVEGTM